MQKMLNVKSFTTVDNRITYLGTNITDEGICSRMLSHMNVQAIFFVVALVALGALEFLFSAME